MNTQRISMFLAASLIILVLSSFVTINTSKQDKIKWYTWEEAIAANEKEPRKIVVDIYTDWCHWCKVMDKKTFSKRKVVEYVNANFYPVKFNAEQKEDITFQGYTFKYIASGRKGYHELAGAFLDGNLSYPSMVYLNEKSERIMISPGYKEVKDFLSELEYAKEEHYTNTSFEEFKQLEK